MINEEWNKTQNDAPFVAFYDMHAVTFVPPDELNFSYIAMVCAPIHDFLEVHSPVLHTVFFASHWLLSCLTIVETMVSGESGMDPTTMTIISPQNEIGRAGIEPATSCSQVLYATD